MLKKYEYKRVSVKGISCYLTAIKEQSFAPALISLYAEVKANKEIEMFYNTYGEEIKDKTSEELKTMFLNHYGSDGWKVVAYESSNESYLLMRETYREFLEKTTPEKTLREGVICG